MRPCYATALFAAAFCATLVWAQSKPPISTDGSDPSKWDLSLDGPKAAAGNHKIIFENENIRVQSVTVPPGTAEPYHLHPYYSILVIDGAPANITDRDAKGSTIANSPVVEQAKTFPVIFVQPPQSPHSIKNDDPAQPVHLIRIESKKAIPRLLSFPNMGPIASQGALPISTDGSDPAKWDPQKASAIAAPGNHKILFENDNLRVISVTTFAGKAEPYHDHPYYSLLTIDGGGRTVDHDGTGKVVPSRQTGDARPMPPFAFLQPPQSLHAIENLDKEHDGHLIRIEFKKGFRQL
jgi:quercetin dioxygenase-like cupin family protein